MNRNYILHKTHLTRLRHKGQANCALKTCGKPLNEGDEVARLGSKFYHLACSEQMYADYEEVKADE